MKYIQTISTLVALAGAASAQAQGQLNIYGTVDAAVQRVTPGDGAKSFARMDPGVGYANRLGLRGTEDLGAGLSSSFVLEMGFAADTGALQQGGALFGRQAFVALGSGQDWTLSVGRHYSPLVASMATLDALGQSYWGNTQGTGIGIYQSPRSIVGDGGHQATTRVNNSALATVRRGAFTVHGMAAAGDENSAGTGRLYGLDVQYANGPLTLAAAANRFRQYAKDIPAGSEAAWQSEFLAGAVFKLEAATVFTGYYSFDPSESNKVIGPSTLLDTNSWWLGARAPVGKAGTLIAQVMRTRLSFPGAGAGAGAGAGGKARTMGLAYEHVLSRRTSLYVSYGQVSNDSAGIASLFSATTIVNLPAVAGADPRVLAFGVTHRF